MNKMYKALTVVGAISFFLAGCANTTPRTINNSIVSNQEYKDFVPIDPIESPQVTYYDSKGSLATKAWAQLSNKEILDLLPNIQTETSVAKKDASGNLTYLVAKATAETGNYLVVMDYTRYRPEQIVDDVSKKELGLRRIGVGMRITADINTAKSDIGLTGIFALGVAASLNKLKGVLSVQILGIGTANVDSLTVMNANIDETSIQKTLEGMAAVKAKIADHDTKLTPQILWVKPTADGVTLAEVISGFKSNAITSEWVGISNQIDTENLPDEIPVDLAKVPHRTMEDIVRLTFKEGVVSGTRKGKREGNDLEWEISGYLRHEVIVLAYRTVGPQGRGFGTQLMVAQDNLSEVYVGYLEGRECVINEIVKYPYILVKGKPGSIEVKNAKQKYDNVLKHHGVAVNPLVCK